MLKRFGVLLALCLLALPLQAQTISDVPVNGVLISANDAATARPNQSPSVSIQLSGTWVGTVTFEGSANGGTTYVSALGTSVTDGSTATTATANGVWVFGNGGYDAIRARFSTATSGNVLVNITRGFAQVKLASPVYTNAIANAFCVSNSTKDSYVGEVAANDIGLYTNGTNCTSGTVRLDLTSTRALFAVPAYLSDGTAAAPSATFASSTNSGMYWDGNWNFSYAGTRQLFIGGSGLAAVNTLAFDISNQDTKLVRDGPGILVQRNGTNAQVFKLATGASTSFRFASIADAQGNFTNDANTAGIGLDVATDSTLKIRTRAQSAYGTVDALAYNASGAAGVSGTCDTPTFTGGVVTTCGGAGNSVDGTYFVTGNFTTANNTNFQLITGLAWTFPANAAVNTPFRCSLTYSQATAAVSDSLGIQDVTVAPTNGMFGGSAETALGTTAYGDLTAFSSTTATAVVTFTPSAIATIFQAYIDGMIEQPSNASTSSFQIQIKTTAGADAITVYRGSYCKVG